MFPFAGKHTSGQEFFHFHPDAECAIDLSRTCSAAAWIGSMVALCSRTSIRPARDRIFLQSPTANLKAPLRPYRPICGHIGLGRVRKQRDSDKRLPAGGEVLHRDRDSDFGRAHEDIADISYYTVA